MNPNNTNINNTDFSDTTISYPIGDEPMENSSDDTIGLIDEHKAYKDLIKKNIDYDIIRPQYGHGLMKFFNYGGCNMFTLPTIRITNRIIPKMWLKAATENYISILYINSQR